MESKTMGITEWLLLVTLSVLWGGSFFFNAVALADLPPFTVVFARVAIAALVLWLIITILLGAGFVTMEIIEFTGMIAAGAGPDVSGFLSAFFTLVGTHGLHVSLGIIMIARAKGSHFLVYNGHDRIDFDEVPPARSGTSIAEQMMAKQLREQALASQD